MTNSGTTSLTGVSVTDNKNSVTCGSSTLAVGAHATCTGNYTITAADMTAGVVTNTATANATGGISSSPSTVSLRITGPADGSNISNATVPQSGFTASTPFSSGQQVDVTVPANADLPVNSNVLIVECNAPGGAPPPDPSYCQGDTIQGVSIHPNPNGSLDLHAQKNVYYSLYALPDYVSFQETSGPACDLVNDCILYIGDNQNDFTYPHYWSAPFSIAPNGDDLGENPGDGSALTGGLTLTKATTSTGYTAAGQTIPYTYLVNNTSNEPLTGISVTDNMNTVSCPSSTLAPEPTRPAPGPTPPPPPTSSTAR